MFLARGYRFHFYSSEGDPREPLHIHVAKRAEGDAKLWLYPEMSIAYYLGLGARAERWLIDFVNAHEDDIATSWHDYFGTSD